MKGHTAPYRAFQYRGQYTPLMLPPLDDMLKTLHQISSALLAALGAVHAALTPVFRGRFPLGALWLAGPGLAMLFVGLLKHTPGRGVGRVPAAP